MCHSFAAVVTTKRTVILDGNFLLFSILFLSLSLFLFCLTDTHGKWDSVTSFHLMLTWLICSRVDNGEEDEWKKEKSRKIILMSLYLFHAVHCLNSAKLIPLSLPTETSAWSYMASKATENRALTLWVNYFEIVFTTFARHDRLKSSLSVHPALSPIC